MKNGLNQIRWDTILFQVLIMIYIYLYGKFLGEFFVIFTFIITAINLIYILYELEKIHHVIFNAMEKEDNLAILDKEKKKSLDHIVKIKKLYLQGDRQELLDYIDKSQKSYYDEAAISFEVEMLNIIIQRYLHICKLNNIELIYDIQSNVKTLLEAAHLSGEELCTVLGNLMDNAIDATQKYKGPKIIKMIILGNGHQVLVAVENTGNVIEESIMSKLFNYGFSTKAKSRGAGLFIVYKLTQKLGASLSVESSAEQTSFKVIFNLS